MERFSQDRDCHANRKIWILTFLSSLFGEEYVIFKDKYDSEILSGEGYAAGLTTNVTDYLLSTALVGSLLSIHPLV